MLHNHGSVDNPILFKFSVRWGEGCRERESERMLLPMPLAETDFKNLSKKLCVQFSSLVILFHLNVYFSSSLFVFNSCMVYLINAFLERN